MPYEARREEDGFYTITGVPVFAEVPKGVKGAPFAIDQSWLQDAVKNSKQRAKEGYLPPLHFEHHGGTEHSFKAGHYRLTRVGRVKIGGVTKYAVFADFTKVPEHVFEAILRNEWPYRSVEIASYQEREIESIALLDDDTPFHKFELLNGDTIRVEDGDRIRTEPLGAVAFGRTDRETTVALFHFGGEKQMHFKIKWDADTGKFVGTGDHADAVIDIDEASVAAFKKKHKAEEDEDNLPKDEAELKKLQKRVTAALKKFEDDEDDDDKNKPAETDDKGMKGNALPDVEALAKFDSMQSRIDALEADKAAREDAAARTKLVNDAVAKLRDDGYYVSDDTVEGFHVYAKAGEDVLTRNVADYRRLTKRDGPETLEDGEDGLVTFDNDPLADKFTRLGDDAAAAYADAAQMFHRMVERGMKRDSDRERFITNEMEYRGFKAAS